MKDFIHNNVCNLRTRKGITQEALADAIGITRQTVIAIEKGNYTPSIMLALKLADFFNVPVENIFSIHHEK